MKISLKSPADIEKMRVAGRLAADVLAELSAAGTGQGEGA